MDSAVPADHMGSLKEKEKRALNFLCNLKKTMEYEGDIDNNCT